MISQDNFEKSRIAAPGEPHLACVLLVDTSASMSGEPIESLNRAIDDFRRNTLMDSISKKRVDVAIIQFDDHAKVVQDFMPVFEMESIDLETGGCNSAMGEGINLAIDKVKERKRFYASNGTPSFKPWIFMITDGTPTDDITSAIQRIKQEESKGAYGKLNFFTLGVPGYDKDTIFKLTEKVMALSDTDFSGIFNWLSEICISGVLICQAISIDLPSNVHIVKNDL